MSSGVIHGTASFPGVISVASCRYTLSHGIGPATALLTMNPQDDPPAEFGDLTFTDNAGVSFVIPQCKLDALDVQQDGSGTSWVLKIVDRRWKWAFGSISLQANQLDPHGKLIPWTIYSPQELAVLCLAAAGETGYDVSGLPPGLGHATGQNISAFLPTGLNFPPTGTNPPINWVGIPPMVALQQLADLFNCRIVYRLATDSVLVTPLGIGAALPAGSLAKQGPELEVPEMPDAVSVLGSPTRIQMWLDLAAYGEEWDGSYRPINYLSYAPQSLVAQPQIYTATFAASGAAGVTFQLSLYFDATLNPATAQAQGNYTTSLGDTGATVASYFANAITISKAAQAKMKLTAAATGNVLTITGGKNGFSFPCQVQITSANPPAGNSVVGTITQRAKFKGADWTECDPPDFYGVQAVPGRLTEEQARGLAQKSVFKVYRLSGKDVSGNGPAIVPGYGPIQRIQQLVLQDTCVSQVVPQPLDNRLLGPDGKPLTINFYNGYSRDVPAQIYGSVCQEFFAGQVYVDNQSLNSDDDDQVFVPFSIDPVLGQTTFSDYVFVLNWADGSIVEPTLTLVTAVLVRDPVTNQLLAYQQTMPLPGPSSGTNALTRVYPDVQLNIIGIYDNDSSVLLGVQQQNSDAQQRATYYLNGMAAQFFLAGAQVAEYNGLIGPGQGLDCDGRIQQITWSVGGDGCSTIASANTEHQIYVPPYPQRRLREALPGIIQKIGDDGRVVMPPDPGDVGGAR